MKLLRQTFLYADLCCAGLWLFLRRRVLVLLHAPYLSATGQCSPQLCGGKAYFDHGGGCKESVSDSGIGGGSESKESGRLISTATGDAPIRHCNRAMRGCACLVYSQLLTLACNAMAMSP